LVYSSGSTPYFVLIARSLKETEIRENRELAVVFGGWLIAIAGCIGFVCIKRYLPTKTV